MTSAPLPLDVAGVEIVLCDADGNLFPSEDPAFVASALVTNRLLAEIGVDRRFAPDELRRFAEGRNFRKAAHELAALYDVSLDPALLDRYVETERREVTAYLGGALAPDPDVIEPLTALAQRYRLAAVSSSSTRRLDACFRATRLDDLFPPHVRFSAEDSLAAPTSKPDPAIYAYAGAALGADGSHAVAVEDAVAGVQSAVGAGFPTVGNLVFVAADERDARAAALTEAGAVAIVDSWRELADLLARTPGATAASGRAAEPSQR